MLANWIYVFKKGEKIHVQIEKILEGCHRLNVCVPLQIHMLNPNVQRDGIWSEVFGRWFRSQRWNPLTNEISILIKISLAPPPPCEVTHGHLGTRKWAPTRHRVRWGLDLAFPSLQNHKKQILLFISHRGYGTLLKQVQSPETKAIHKNVGNGYLKTTGITDDFQFFLERMERNSSFPFPCFNVL